MSPRDQIRGLPKWASDWDGGYDVGARAGRPVSLDDCRTMLQSLLADRFALRRHRESRTVNGYALRATDGGRRLAAITRSGKWNRVILNHPTLDWPGPEGLTRQELARILGGHPAVGAPVADRTGLDRRYVFNLQFSARDGDDRPSIFTALKELALELEPAPIALEVIAIDRMEPPSRN